MSMARILFKSPLNPWSICLLVIAPNIPTTIKFSHREHTCEHCNFCRSTCNCFFFVPFCSFLYLNSLSLSQSRLNWIEMWAQSSEPWALFGSLSFQFWQKISSGEDGQRILNMFFSYFHHLKSASKFLAWCCPPDVWQHNIEYQRNVAITHFPGTLPTSTRPPHQCQLPQSKTHTQRCSTFFIQFCVGKIIC